MGSPSVERARELPAESPKTGFRLRHLLVLALMGWGLSWLVPRSLSAWKLHNLAVAYADYSLCMVGPTGADVLSSDPEEFRELVRLRLISAMPDDRPLLRCEPLAEKMELEHKAFRLHSGVASNFKEYHHEPQGRASLTLRHLDVDPSRLEVLAEKSWPFVRKGARELMIASSHAKEAAHPGTPPQVGWGTGLPASRTLYRSSASFGDVSVVALGSGANAQVLMSRNRGIDFRPGGTRLAADLRDRCGADDEGRGFAVTKMSDGRRVVVSQGPEAAPQVAVLSDPDQEIAGISCDAYSLFAAVALKPDAQGRRPIKLRLCAFRRSCRDMGLPEMGGSALYYPVDIAKIGGDIIVSRLSGGITRVASSRDNGRTWMPWVVAYDSESQAQPYAAPFRLLPLGDSLLLYTGGAGRYPLLVSEDHGASFQQPKVTEAQSAPPLMQAKTTN